MNNMDHRGSARRRQPSKEPSGPRKKSKFPPIFMTLGLGVMIFCLFYFSPGREPQAKSEEMSSSEIQLFDQKAWTDTLSWTFALYAQVKRTGYDLEREQVDREDTARRYCGEALAFFTDHRAGLEGLAAMEPRGGAPAYTRAGVAFLDAARDVVLALRAEAEKDPETDRVSFEAFEKRIRECDALINSLREARIEFLTPALTEQKLEETINAMDTLLMSVQ